MRVHRILMCRVLEHTPAGMTGQAFPMYHVRKFDTAKVASTYYRTPAASGMREQDSTGFLLSGITCKGLLRLKLIHLARLSWLATPPSRDLQGFVYVGHDGEGGGFG